MHPDPAAGQPGHGISMWGAPGSGKTTLLAALNIALTRSEYDWKIVGSDPGSSDQLIEWTTTLSSGRSFPEATTTAYRYRWVLIGPDQPGRGLLRRRRKEPTRINIDLLDAPGGWFSSLGQSRGTGENDLDDELLDSLTESRGIIFLFDPIREFNVGDAYDHLYAPLLKLSQRMLGTTKYAAQCPGGKLPHHVAVCVTKFDDHRVLETAEREGLLDDISMRGVPGMSDESARALFGALCQVSRDGDPEMVLNSLDKYFHHDRVRFFATSSVGFYTETSRSGFRWEDPENVVPEAREGGEHRYRIRGQVRPINVVEPMIWLGQRLAAR